MNPEAPIRIIALPVDPYSKQSRAVSHAEFDLAPLGITRIEGVDVSASPPVRLPPGAEPGCCYTLEIGFNGSVIALEDNEAFPSLFAPCRIIITEGLTVQLVKP